MRKRFLNSYFHNQSVKSLYKFHSGISIPLFNLPIDKSNQKNPIRSQSAALFREYIMMS
ncbi:hypothetical protein XIS1_1100009 [Xenorhabdus innexi]|uniref:Uncharacterized protein n=1 Tax=Xenorhabdus innexi TaxID=290109 RepID=A0A1N6MQT7_9GAMM|nr:hypothetical protein XIS1_1100009 [Xenorhabdus innexi]